MPSFLNTAVATGGGLNQVLGATRDVFSAEIWFQALPIMKFDQFTTKRTELGVQPGRVINLPKYGQIKRGGALTEAKRLSTQAMSLTQQQIVVTEYGNAVGFTEFLLQTSFYDQLAAASMLLGRDMAIVLDTALRDAIVQAVNVVYAAGRTTRAQLQTGDTFDVAVIRDATETLETNNSPKWAGDHYICFMHPHQARGLRETNGWQNASLYSGAGQIYTGELGRYDDVRFISTTVMPNGANGARDPSSGDYVDIGHNPALAVGVAGNQTTIYQAVFFGEYSLGHATALPVELRDNGVEDYGREHGLAWYSIFGQNILEQANIVIAETA